MMRRVAHTRSGRAGSLSVLLSVMLLGLAGLVSLAGPAAAQVIVFPELSNVTLTCAGEGQFRLQGTATCADCPAGEVVWFEYCSGGACGSPHVVASGDFPIAFDLTSDFASSYSSIWVDARYPVGPAGSGAYIDSGTTELIKPACGLTVVKEADPPDDTPFSFDCTGSQYSQGEPGGCNFELRDPSAPSISLGDGRFIISEALPPGWALDDVSCMGTDAWDVQGEVLTLSVGLDEAVTCTFHNERRQPEFGRIIVKKGVSPADAPAGLFEFDPSWGPNFSLAGGQSHDSGPLPAGVYSVSEVLPLAEGWSLASAFCDDGSSPSAIGVSPGETVTCTFNNRYQPPEEPPTGSLTILKMTSPAGGTGFSFDAGSLGDFILDHGGSQLFGDLAAGEYTVTETPPAGWEFEDVVCYTAPGAAVDYEVVGSGVVVNLAEGQDVICKFANREEETVGPEGSLTIIKHTVPAGGEGFVFDAGVLGTFSLDDGGMETFTGLVAGAYTVTETPAADWGFASVECDALDYDVDGPSVTVNLAEGEAAVCTFSNGELPYTGSQPFTMPLLIAGLSALLAGLVLWVRSLMREAEKT
jgi:hypothetical protein